MYPQGTNWSLADLITIKNKFQNSEEDINIEVVPSDLEEVHTQQGEVHSNKGQFQEIRMIKGNTKKGPSVVTRAHRKNNKFGLDYILSLIIL